MSKVANSRAIADALRAHAVALTATADALESAPPSSERSEYVDQHTSPLSKVVYLKFAKAGAFPSRKVGKRVLALREDFEVFRLAAMTHIVGEKLGSIENDGPGFLETFPEYRDCI